MFPGFPDLILTSQVLLTSSSQWHCELSKGTPEHTSPALWGTFVGNWVHLQSSSQLLWGTHDCPWLRQDQRSLTSCKALKLSSPDLLPWWLNKQRVVKVRHHRRTQISWAYRSFAVCCCAFFHSNLVQNKKWDADVASKSSVSCLALCIQEIILSCACIFSSLLHFIKVHLLPEMWFDQKFTGHKCQWNHTFMYSWVLVNVSKM